MFLRHRKCYLAARKVLGRRRKSYFAALRVLGIVALLLGASCWFFGIGSRQDVTAYYCMASEPFDPVWKALTFHRFGRGSSLNKLMAAYPPVSVEEFPPYKLLRYEDQYSINDLAVIAKGDALATAFVESRGWKHDFFRMRPVEEGAAELAFSRHAREQQINTEVLRIAMARKEGRNVFVAEVSVPPSGPIAPCSVKVLERLTGPCSVGEVISIARVQWFIRAADVHDGKVAVVVGRSGSFVSVSPEALERARTAASQ